jgi:hypothetical protein
VAALVVALAATGLSAAVVQASQTPSIAFSPFATLVAQRAEAVSRPARPIRVCRPRRGSGSVA